MNYKTRLLITGLFIIWHTIKWYEKADFETNVFWVHFSLVSLLYILGLISVLIGTTKSKGE